MEEETVERKPLKQILNENNDLIIEIRNISERILSNIIGGENPIPQENQVVGSILEEITLQNANLKETNYYLSKILDNL